MTPFLKILAHVTLVMAISLALMSAGLVLAGHRDVVPEWGLYVWLGIAFVSAGCYCTLIILELRRKE